MGAEVVNSIDQQTMWSDSGYVTEIPYMRDYMRYQAPITMAFAAAANGFGAPDYRKPFRYCDLGCGEAVTTLALAAAYPHGTFVGVDLNPTHIENAEKLAQAAGLENVTFLKADFEDPRIEANGPFDFVASHGVYSWVAPDVQSQFHSLVGRIIKDGGLLYFCHYVRPGAGKIEVMFQLIQSLMKDKKGTLLERVKAALSEARAMYDEGAPIFEYHSSLGRYIDELENRDARYLVHEFCNRFFYPRFFAQVAEDLGAVGLQHVGSTRFERNGLRTLFGDGVPKALEGLDHGVAEDRASLLGVDQFRWDVFRKQDVGAENQRPASEQLSDFILDSAVFPYGYPKSATLWDTEVVFDQDAFQAISALATTGRQTIGEILAHPSLTAIAADKALMTVLQMVGSRNFHPIVEPAGVPIVKPQTRLRFATHFPAALGSRDLLVEGYLSVPSTSIGGVISLTGFEGLAALAHDGRNRHEAFKELSGQILALTETQGKRLKSHRFSTEPELQAAWSKFERTTLPLLVKYGVLVASESLAEIAK